MSEVEISYTESEKPWYQGGQHDKTGTAPELVRVDSNPGFDND